MCSYKKGKYHGRNNVRFFIKIEIEDDDGDLVSVPETYYKINIFDAKNGKIINEITLTDRDYLRVNRKHGNTNIYHTKEDNILKTTFYDS